MASLEKVRIDKWLWSVRIFKTRSIATDACKSGRVKAGESAVKAAYMLTVGEVVQVRKRGFTFTYRVLSLIAKRVSAPLAQACYEDITPEEERNKYKNWYVGKGKSERRERGTGRPTKKERRSLDRFKDDD